MRLRHLKIPFSLLFLFLILPAQGAELLVDGNGQGIWIALVTPAGPNELPGEKTRIRFREFGSDTTWRELRTLNSVSLNLVSRGRSAAVLLSGGDWLLAWPGGDSVGPSLPRQRKIVYIGGDKDTLLAIAEEAGFALPSTARVATAPAANGPASTAPGTSPATTQAEPSGRSVYRFSESKWERLASLPDDLPVEKPQFRLLSVGGKLILAAQGSGGVIRLLQLEESGSWSDRGLVSPKIDPRFFDLLNINGRAMLWVSDSAGSALLYDAARGTSEPLKLPASRAYASDARRAVVFAGGNIREIILEAENDKIRLFEQCFRPDGAPSSDLMELAVPKSQLAPVSNFPSMLLMLGLTVLILSTIRRNEPEPSFEAGGQIFRLAPLHHRAAAALIDLAPILIMIGFIQWQAERGQLDRDQLLLPMVIGFGLYFGHTTLGELFTSRTIGKRIMGLKVVTMEGVRPNAASLLIRNLLRAVDVFSPVAIMIFFTPLRQRIGDITARTVVITTRQVEPETPVEDDATS